MKRGVRQGSIISPWIFNCFYRDVECGLIIGNNRYNIICYADDLLLTSATSTGLHTLINSCQKYVEEHGLCFNPTKTSCTVIGKSPFTTEATFYISGVELQNAKTFKHGRGKRSGWSEPVIFFFFNLIFFPGKANNRTSHFDFRNFFKYRFAFYGF